MSSSKKRSWVWAHCTSLNNGLNAKCNICDEIFQNKGSTSCLIKHLTDVHGYSTDSKGPKQQKSVEEGNEAMDIDEVNESCQVDADQATSSGSSNNTVITRSRRRKQVRFTEITDRPCSQTRAELIGQAIAKLIVKNMLPISIVQSEGFLEFMAILEPSYQVPCRETIMKRIHLIYDLTKTKVKNELGKIPNIVAVSDCWTSRAQDAYITVSAHFVDSSWEPQCVCLATQLCNDRHTAVNLCKKMTEIIQEYKLDRKITTVVTDNAKNAVNSVEMMEGVDVIDAQCTAHTLQLAVNDGLKIESIKKLCSKAGQIVAHFRHSNVANKALEMKQEQLGLEKLKLMQSCVTRWNSTYFMIERLNKNRSAVEGVLSDRAITKATVAKKLEIQEAEWQQLECLVKVLKPFDLATKALSTENRSPISMVRPVIRAIINNHLKSDEVEDEVISEVKRVISESLKSRFGMTGTEINEDITSHQIASFLDPRYKDLEAEETDNRRRIREHTRNLILESTFLSDASNNTSKPSAMDYLFNTPKQTNNSTDQFVKYLAEPLIDRNLCPFEWWKNHENRYPALADLAKKYLSIPASSTASERVFSSAGNIVTPKRSCLDPDNVDILVFLYQNRYLINN